ALIFILNVLLFKPLLGMIDKRKKQFADSRAEVQRLQAATDREMAVYKGQLFQAQAAAVVRRNEIILEGTEEANKIVNAVRSEIPALMAQFHERMDGELAAAKALLANESQRLSVEIAEKVLGRPLR
ncbi:MAG: ATP synthase F0 subunit B, partial [Syntrophaceae bacterium]|nr:ATP synthase F0 subunit B [Syntrophaceae bacterium]